MNNAQYLEQAIANSGKKKSFLATKCGMSRQYFARKCKNPTSFTGKQIGILCEELQITRADARKQIFFA